MASGCFTRRRQPVAEVFDYLTFTIRTPRTEGISQPLRRHRNTRSATARPARHETR
jgi:hypothetical protein